MSIEMTDAKELFEPLRGQALEQGAQIEAILDNALDSCFAKGLSQFDVLTVTMQWLSVRLLRLKLEERMALQLAANTSWSGF
jgi:hypothetical protein